MNASESLLPDRKGLLLANLLRVILAMQCFGYAAKLFFTTQKMESPVYSYLLKSLEWAPEKAMGVERWGMILYLVCGLLLLIPCLMQTPSTPRWSMLGQGALLIFIIAWTLAIATAGTFNMTAFMWQWTYAEHATRFLGPVALLLLILNNKEAPVSDKRLSAVEWILRIAAAFTFFGHGLVAMFHAPGFCQLILGTSENFQQMLPGFAATWLEKSVTQSSTEVALTLIGLIDIVLAIGVVVVRSRGIALYMAFWGGVAALSRITALGGPRYPEAFIRTANAGVPLLVFLYWYYFLHKTKTKDERVEA